MPAAVAERPRVGPRFRVVRTDSGVLDAEFKLVSLQWDPLEGISADSRRVLDGLHKDRRILVVDDVKASGEMLQRDLQAVFRADRNCVVDYANSPEEALERMTRARDGGRPYDTLVTDLYMQKTVRGEKTGFNGDELLRKLADRGIVLPTVVVSGSWADEIAVNLFDQLSVVRSETELAKMGVLIKKDLGGVPVTYKKKFEGAGFLRDLVLAVDAVHLAGQHGMDGMKDFLEKFRPRVVESNLNLESIARIAELKKVLAKRWLEYRRIFVEKFPGFQESWVCKHVDPCIKGLSEPKYSFRHMAQEGDLGSNARHDVYGYINIICQNIDPNHVVKCNNQAPEARRVPAAILSNPEFMKLLAGMSREFSSMHNMVNLLRLASKKMERDVFDLSQRMKNVTEYPETEAASVKLELCPNLWVEGDILTTLLLRQPFTNAAKSVRDSPKKEVVVSTQKIKLGELKEGMETVHHRKEAYEYLKSLRLGDEDIVYRMQVRDTGVGIPPENMARIFEDGFSTFGTIGFGLWFLDQRIGNYKGTYDVESKVGVGTTFNLYFKPSKPPKELRGLLKS